MYFIGCRLVYNIVRITWKSAPYGWPRTGINKIASLSNVLIRVALRYLIIHHIDSPVVESGTGLPHQLCCYIESIRQSEHIHNPTLGISPITGCLED